MMPPLLDLRIPGAQGFRGLLEVEEGALLSLRLYIDPTDCADIRVYIGNVLVASTIEGDWAPEFEGSLDEDQEFYQWKARLFRDWVGQADLEFRTSDDVVICHVPCFVSASKMHHDAFNRLVADVADYSAALLLDIYGKTYVGLQLERQLGEHAPVALVNRVDSVVAKLEDALRHISRRPGYKLRERTMRMPAAVGEPVTEEMLLQACQDTTLLATHRVAGTYFRDRIVHSAARCYRTYENRAIGGFLSFLKAQLVDLNRQIENELDTRERRRHLRSRPTPGAKFTWWEQDDLPRIKILKDLKALMVQVGQRVDRLARHPILSLEDPLLVPPATSQLVRFHPGYRSAFEVIRTHLTAYSIQVDDAHLLNRAKGVPVLYEWWCMLQVMSFLSRHLKLKDDRGPSSRNPFRIIGEGRRRLIIEFAEDQTLDFSDEAGRLVRFRYQPKYVNSQTTPGITYGILGPGKQKTPDISLEVWEDSAGLLSEPSIIIVLDAKYSYQAHEEKIGEVRRKYAQIGRFRDGHNLSRQVWALTVAPAASTAQGAPDWAQFCTVDNWAFWAPDFSTENTQVAGAVQTLPGVEAGTSPLELLLARLLKLSGVNVP